MKTRIDIDRPAGVVFDFVADQTNAPRWQQGDTRSASNHATSRRRWHRACVCAPVRQDEHRVPEPLHARTSPAASSPSRFPTARSLAKPRTWSNPAGASSSRLISAVDFRLSGLAGLATPVLARVFERDSRKAMAALKDILEQGGD